MALQHEGASVTQADSVPAAMSAAASDDFSVLVSDPRMPGEDGYDLNLVVCALARLHPGFASYLPLPSRPSARPKIA